MSKVVGLLTWYQMEGLKASTAQSGKPYIIAGMSTKLPAAEVSHPTAKLFHHMAKHKYTTYLGPELL